jgi:hypothetical protein
VLTTFAGKSTGTGSCPAWPPLASVVEALRTTVLTLHPPLSALSPSCWGFLCIRSACSIHTPWGLGLGVSSCSRAAKQDRKRTLGREP